MSKAMIRIFSGLVTGVLIASLNSAAMAAPQIRWLNHPSGGVSDAGAVSADGSVVFGSYHETNLFRWSETTGMQGLGTIPGHNWPGPVDVSGDGLTTITHSENGINIWSSYRWTAASGLVPLSTLGGPVHSMVTGISHDGSVIVGRDTTGSTQNEVFERPFRWTAAGGTQYLPGLSGAATDVSADGSVVVGYTYDAAMGGTTGGKRWTFSGDTVTETPLDFFPDRVSADGQSIVGFPEQGWGQAVRWTQQHGTVPLNSGGSEFTWITGISGDGSTIVGFNDAGYHYRALIWDQALGVRDLKEELVNRYGLDLTGVALIYAFAISEDSQTIVGYGEGPDSLPQAWVVTIPEPASLSLLMLTLPLSRRSRARAVIT
jgi:uncharacterized membrane protein